MSVLRAQRIGLIGAGTMGQALIKGLLAQGVSPKRLSASDASAAIRRAVKSRFKITVSDENRAIARRCGVLILAVKPQQFAEVVGELAPALSRDHLVISIAAGITLRWLQRRLPGVPIVRVMPNLPATVGCGFAAIALGHAARPAHRAIAQAIFGGVGEVIELPERHFDVITAVSGSGPAYVFFLVRAWEQTAKSLGLPSAVARRAILVTLAGGLVLLDESGISAEELIARVASKGGTTEAALKVLARRHVAAHFGEALRAAARRSRQLAWS